MPTTINRARLRTAVLAVLALVASILVLPAPAAQADTAACPGTTPSAGFTDIGGFDHETTQSIDCLAFYGITKGTSATTFSPNDDVNRWQMALFLTRKLTTAGYTLGSGASQGFLDIGTLDAATQTAINQLAQAGVTTGTSATTFSPTDTVSRWQMALFITRQLTAAGVTLPSGASQGFTDISGLSAATQTAINQLAQLGISKGTSATTFDPTGNVNRWQMALFLARDLNTLGVVPTGIGGVVTSIADNPKIKYSSGGSVITDTFVTTDTFFIDGAVATFAAFKAAISVPDLINIVGDVWSITNVSTTAAKSGLVSDVKNTAVFTFTFTEPVSGAVTRLWDYDDGAVAHELYTVDGAAANLAAFDADISVGDTVVVSGGDGSTAAKARTFALTNGSASGTISTDGGATFSMKPSGGAAWDDTITPAVDDSDDLTVDGVSKTQVQFAAAQTVGDLVTYSRKLGKQTISLTNQAPAAVTGLASTFTATLALDIARTSGATTVTYATAGVGGTAEVGTYVVNGVVGVKADFEGKLTLGDTITYQADDASTTADESKLSLVDGSFSGEPETSDDAAFTVTILMNKQESVLVDYDLAADITAKTGLTVSGSGVIKYQVDGGTAAAANKAAFAAALELDEVQNKGNVSVAKVGNDVVWSVTTS